MNWEEIEISATDKNATEGELALLFLDAVAKIESSGDLTRLLNLFFCPQCNLNSDTITSAVENIKAHFTFEIHNHPGANEPKTAPGGRNRDVIA